LFISSLDVDFVSRFRAGRSRKPQSFPPAPLRAGVTGPMRGGIKEVPMVRVGLLAKLEAKPGKESAVAEFLASAQPLAAAEPETTVWFALRLGPSTFGIFDAFPSDAGRKAHLSGPIASALMAKASELLAKPPEIEQVDVLASKIPG
jgi:quinol monooxygenase YgiN